MFKTFVIALATTALGAGTADAACPRRCSSPCTTSPCTAMTSPDATAAAAPAPAPAATSQAQSGERTYRSFSYEPTQRSYSAPITRGSRTSGFRDAGSKIRGDYGR